MQEKDILIQMEQLRVRLKQLDRERNGYFKLDELRAKHRTLGSPDSETVLYLIRRLLSAEGEINRLNKIIKCREGADKNRAKAKAPAEAVA